MTNAIAVAKRALESGGERPAVESDLAVRSCTQLWLESNHFAEGLNERDVTDGTCVVICVEDPIRALVAVYGTLRNGCVPVTVPPSYRTDDLLQVLAETAAPVLVLEGQSPTGICARAEGLRLAVTVDSNAFLGVDFETFLENDGLGDSGRTSVTVLPRGDDDRGLIAYVGHHDGAPLGVVYTHRSLHEAVRVGRSLWDGRSIQRYLTTQPLWNPLALLSGATTTIASGGTYCPSDDGQSLGDTLKAGTEDGRLAVVTAQAYGDLLAAGVQPGRDDLVVVDPTTTAADAQADGTRRVCGLPETGLTHVRTAADIRDHRLGKPVASIDARVLEGPDGGELAISGPATIDAYFERPDLTAAVIESIDGHRWIRTGAHARLEAGEILLEPGSEVLEKRV